MAQPNYQYEKRQKELAKKKKKEEKLQRKSAGKDEIAGEDENQSANEIPGTLGVGEHSADDEAQLPSER